MLSGTEAGSARRTVKWGQTHLRTHALQGTTHTRRICFKHGPGLRRSRPTSHARASGQACIRHPGAVPSQRSRQFQRGVGLCRQTSQHSHSVAVFFKTRRVRRITAHAIIVLLGGGGRKDLRGWDFTCVVPRGVSGSAYMCVYVMYIVGIPRYGARPRPRCDGPRRCGKGQKWAPSRCHCAGAHVPCKSRVSSCRQIASISIVPQSTGL